MTHRRWRRDGDEIEAELAIGPVETQVRAELKALGWDEDKPGHLSTAAAVCVALAETLDHTNAARDVASLSRELAARLKEAREAKGGRRLSVVEQAAARKSRRGPGAAGPRRSAG